MKVTIKTDPETLFLLHRLILDACQTTGRTSAKSMYAELFEIFSKKCIQYSANPSAKLRTITLRYHLASALLDLVIRICKHPSLGPYEQNKLEIIKNQLHRML